MSKPEVRNLPTKEEEVEMMKDPGRWPVWPILPLKKRGQADMGCMFNGSLEGENTDPTVYLVNMFQLSKDSPKKTYESFEALVDDGWVVD